MLTNPSSFDDVLKTLRLQHEALTFWAKARLIELENCSNETKQGFYLEVNACRETADKYAVLALWALFEAQLNDWFVSLAPMRILNIKEFDDSWTKVVDDRIEKLQIEQKISLLRSLIGDDSAKTLRKVLVYRNWVAHQKIVDRPEIPTVEVVAIELMTAINNLLSFVRLREST